MLGKRTFVLSMVLSLTALLSFVYISGAEENDRPDRAVLEMIVTDGATGVPVHAYITVRYGDMDVAKAETDRSGSARLEIKAGNFTYTIEARGYEPVRGKVHLDSGDAVSLTISMEPSGEEEPDPDPQPYGVIFGQVFGPEKTPLGGITVIFVGMGFRDPASSYEPPTNEPGPDGTLNPYGGDPFRADVVTDKEGNFKVRVPFGTYQIIVETEKLLPFISFVEVNERNKEVRTDIFLERRGGDVPEPPSFGRFVIEFGLIDEDSDGNPEKVHLMIDMEGDGVPELKFTMVDRNSDGNPEEMVFSSSLPFAIKERLMGMLMMLIQHGSPGPWEGPIWDEGQPPSEGNGEWNEQFEGIDWEELLEGLTGGKGEGEDGTGTSDPAVPASDDGDDVNGAGSVAVTEKDVGKDVGPNYLVAVGALIGLFFLILITFSLGLLIRTSKRGH